MAEPRRPPPNRQSAVHRGPPDAGAAAGAADAGVAAAQRLAGTSIVIIGGISVNDAQGHDKSPWNFINPGVRRAKALSGKGKVKVILFTPSYERRVKNQKTEHSSVHNKAKDAKYFENEVENQAKANSFALIKIKSSRELTDALLGCPDITNIEYFGHSRGDTIFLEYSSIDPGKATAEGQWSKSDAQKVSANHFQPSAQFTSYGCNQGDPGGLAEQLSDLWGIKAKGSRGKTDFEQCGVFGGPTEPASAGGYTEYSKSPPKAP